MDRRGWHRLRPTSGRGVLLSWIATAGRNPPSLPTWYIVGPEALRFASPGVEVFGIEVQVIEAGLRAVEHTEADSLGRHADLRVEAAVNEDGVEERFGHDRSRREGPCFPRWRIDSRTPVPSAFRIWDAVRLKMFDFIVVRIPEAAGVSPLPGGILRENVVWAQSPCPG